MTGAMETIVHEMRKTFGTAETSAGDVGNSSGAVRKTLGEAVWIAEGEGKTVKPCQGRFH
jgi:hypothetical protein